MSDPDFAYVQRLVHERARIWLDDGKDYLVESRLHPVASSAGFASVRELLARLRARPFDRLHAQVVEAMATTETSFFRDLHPFDALRQHVLPELIARRAGLRILNLWCAASASGQEPYSVAMLLLESFPQLANWRVNLLATDFSVEMLTRARAGRYNQIEVNRGLPVTLLVKYFRKQGTDWQIAEEVRRRVEFRELNLAEAWPALPPIDVLLLRNVLIYFDAASKRAILERARRALGPDGYLFLGGTESLFDLAGGFEQVQFDRSLCYRKKA